MLVCVFWEGIEDINNQSYYLKVHVDFWHFVHFVVFDNSSVLFFLMSNWASFIFFPLVASWMCLSSSSVQSIPYNNPLQYGFCGHIFFWYGFYYGKFFFCLQLQQWVFGWIYEARQQLRTSWVWNTLFQTLLDFKVLEWKVSNYSDRPDSMWPGPSLFRLPICFLCSVYLLF